VCEKYQILIAGIPDAMVLLGTLLYIETMPGEQKMCYFFVFVLHRFTNVSKNSNGN